MIMVFVLSFLMVSNIRYLSFKQLDLARIKSFNWLVGALLFFILIAIEPQVVGLFGNASYVILGPVGAKIMDRRMEAKEQSAQPEQDSFFIGYPGLAGQDQPEDDKFTIS